MTREEQSTGYDREGAATSVSRARTMVIMVIDVVGFTTHVQNLGNELALQVFRAHDRVLRRLLERHGGICINHTGDGFVAGFDSVCAAAECAFEIRRRTREHDHLRSMPVRLRIALHHGDILLERGRLFGLSVITAFRLCARAPADCIYATTRYSERAASIGYVFGRAKRVRLKGIVELESICELYAPPTSRICAPSSRRRTESPLSRVAPLQATLQRIHDTPRATT